MGNDDKAPTTRAKVDYVRSQGQTRQHHCHWPGCTRQVPPAKWGCKEHWFRLPKHIRKAIWQAFRPGQERNMSPSHAYLEAALDAQRWIKENGTKDCVRRDHP